MFTSGFFNSVNSDRKYNAEQMSAIFDGIIRDGIFDSVGDHFAVTPGTGLAVSVGTGRAWLNSTWSYNDTAYPIALSAASASLSRIDLICIKVDKSSNVRANSIVCIEGTPASSPVEPTITDDTTNEIYYHKLAAVSVAAGATSISAADITNYVGLAAGTPYVTGILSSTTVDELWSQWDGEFNDWWDDIKATLDDNIVTTILNKIDHITPKESTMNLYGFSNINPPPAGKTYQEYSTDAILNQISSLFSAYGVTIVKLQVLVDNEPAVAGIEVSGFTSIDGVALTKYTDSNGMVIGILPGPSATYTTKMYIDIPSGSVEVTNDYTGTMDTTISLTRTQSGYIIFTESVTDVTGADLGMSPYITIADFALCGPGGDGAESAPYSGGGKGGGGGHIVSVYNVAISGSDTFSILLPEGGSETAATLSINGTQLASAEAGLNGSSGGTGNGNGGNGASSNSSNGYAGSTATEFPFGNQTAFPAGGGGGGGSLTFAPSSDRDHSYTYYGGNGGFSNGGKGGNSHTQYPNTWGNYARNGDNGTFPAGGGGGGACFYSASYYTSSGGKGANAGLYLRWGA